MNKKIYLGLALVALIAIGGYFYPQIQNRLGVAGETNYNSFGVIGLKVGSNCGDSFSSTAANGCKSTTHFIATTCDLIGVEATHAASTTKPYDCAVTGVTSSDVVTAQLATSTPSGGLETGELGFSIVGAKASSTAGYITIFIANFGDSNSLGSNKIGSSTAILIWQ